MPSEMYQNIIQCSMGRDSLALVKYLEPLWEDSLVVWVDAGAALPEIEEIAAFVENTVPHFYRLRTNSAAWIERHGSPVDVVPIWFAEKSAAAAENPTRFASAFQCCFENIMTPMHVFTKVSGAVRLFRGQRNAEKLKSPLRSGVVVDGLEIVFPLEQWTDGQVDSYLQKHGWPLSPTYVDGDKGIDCWH